MWSAAGTGFRSGIVRVRLNQAVIGLFGVGSSIAMVMYIRRMGLIITAATPYMHACAQKQGQLFLFFFFFLCFLSEGRPLITACLFSRGKISYFGITCFFSSRHKRRGRNICGPIRRLSHPSPHCNWREKESSKKKKKKKTRIM